MNKIQPFGDRVVIEIIPQEEVMVGGLILSSSAQGISNKGIVTGVGDGKEVQGIKEGDKVIFNVTSGINYSSDNKDYKVLSVRDIIGKVVEE